MDGDTNDLFMNFCQKKIVTEKKRKRAAEQEQVATPNTPAVVSRHH